MHLIAVRNIVDFDYDVVMTTNHFSTRDLQYYDQIMFLMDNCVVAIAIVY